MSKFKIAGLVLVVLLLFLSMSLGNLLVAAHQTILDPTYANETIANENGYSRAQTIVRRRIAPESPGTNRSRLPLPINRTAIIAESVTRSYLATQGGDLIDRFYAYLHGNRQRPGLWLALTPLKTNIERTVEARLRALPPHEITIFILQRSNTTQSGSGSRWSRLQGAGINATLIAQLDEGPAAYRTVKTRFRQALRNRIINRAVNRSFNQSSPDTLLALVIKDYDPTAYSSDEKQQLVAEREPTIRRALETKIRTERKARINATVDRQLDRLRNRSRRVNATAAIGNDSIATAVDRLQHTTVVAITTDLSYKQYRTRATTARDQLASNVSAVIGARLDARFPDRIELMDRADGNANGQLDAVARGIQWLDRVTILLGPLIVVLIGLLWYGTQSIARTVEIVGWCLVGITAPVVFGSPFLRSFVVQQLPGGLAGELGGALVTGLVGTWRTQSIYMLVIGVGIVAVTVARRYGVVEYPSR
ncbi:MAG: hypothetical protein SVG88_07070 [Halobacteriales archaeon]|nr:hypothetical protein [Halobacteriales archaeon]